MEKKFIITLTFPVEMDNEVLDRVNRIIEEIARGTTAKMNPLIKVEVTRIEGGS